MSPEEAKNSPEFLQWFGGSKTVDEQGNPQVFYHGSPEEDLEDISQSNTSYGLFFTPDPATAEYYTGGRKGRGKVYAVYLRMENPVDFDDPTEFARIAKEALEDDPYRDEEELSGFIKWLWDQRANNEEVAEFFEESGSYDDVFTYLSDYDLDADDVRYFAEEIPELKQKLDEQAPERNRQYDYAVEAYGSQEFYTRYQDDFLQAAENLGHDGVIMTDPSSVGTPVSYVVFDANQVKSVENNGEFDPESDNMFEAVTDNPRFKQWFRNSKVVDDQGDPLRVFHGSTHAFTDFRLDRANSENRWGKGFYFSNTPEDVEHNYAGRGPDLEMRIGNLASQIESILYDPDDEELAGLRLTREEFESDSFSPSDFAQAYAAEELQGQTPNTMAVYLRMENPLVIGGPNPTMWEFEFEYSDDEEEDIVEERGAGFQFTNIMYELLGYHLFSGDFERFWANMGLEDYYGDSVPAGDVLTAFKNNSYFEINYDGGRGENEVLREALETMGYDGIIEYDMKQSIGMMQGINNNTVHFVVFEPEQIKSATGNSGSFNPSSNDIRETFSGLFEEFSLLKHMFVREEPEVIDYPEYLGLNENEKGPVKTNTSEGDPPTDFDQISKAIIKEVGDCDPKEINKGNCDTFLSSIFDRFGGIEEWDYEGHVFGKVLGRYFDAETPYGVERWEDLPYFKRLEITESMKKGFWVKGNTILRIDKTHIEYLFDNLESFGFSPDLKDKEYDQEGRLDTEFRREIEVEAYRKGWIAIRFWHNHYVIRFRNSTYRISPSTLNALENWAEKMLEEGEDPNTECVVYNYPDYSFTVGKLANGAMQVHENRTEQILDRTRTPEFKRWFGDWENDPENASKMVDDQGVPLVFYHGTPQPGYEQFRELAHFTTDPEYASNYVHPSASSMGGPEKRQDGGGGVYPVFLNIRNPFDPRIPAHEKLYDEFTNTFGNRTPLSERGLPDWTDALNLAEWIEETGQPFDGLLLDEGGTPEKGWRGISYVPLKPNQIKSVWAREFSDSDNLTESAPVFLRISEIEEDPTMFAIAPWGEPYMTVYGEEWREMTREQRAAVIEEDEMRWEEEQEEEQERKEQEERNHLEWERKGSLFDKAVETVEKACEKEGLEVSSKTGYHAGSRYVKVEDPDGYLNTIRIGDHPSPPGGGFSVERQESYGDPALDLVIDEDGKFDYQKLIDFLRELKEDSVSESCVKPVFLRLKEIHDSEAWKHTSDEFLSHHNTGDIPLGAYSEYLFKLDFIRLENFPDKVEEMYIGSSPMFNRDFIVVREYEKKFFLSNSIPRLSDDSLFGVLRKLVYTGEDEGNLPYKNDRFLDRAKEKGFEFLLTRDLQLFPLKYSSFDHLIHYSEIPPVHAVIDIRKKEEAVRYVKRDDDDNIVYEKGLAVYLSPEEMKAEGLPETDTTFAAFHGDVAVGLASNEFGSTGVWVTLPYQGHGIGVRLLELFRSGHMGSKKIGQMTGAGRNMTQAYHRLLVKKAAAEGKPVPDEVRAEYGLEEAFIGYLETDVDESLHEMAAGTPAFNRWFKDSKVTDERGEPLRVYHGTPDGRFLDTEGVFRTKRETIFPGSKEEDSAEKAFFFTDDKRVAMTYADDHRAFDYQNADPAVRAFYLSIQNPMVIDAKGVGWGKRGGPKTQMEQILKAKAEGRDGLIIMNTKDTYHDTDRAPVSNIYVAFDSKQVKLATDDVNKPYRDTEDVRESWGGMFQTLFETRDLHDAYVLLSNGRIVNIQDELHDDWAVRVGIDPNTIAKVRYWAMNDAFSIALPASMRRFGTTIRRWAEQIFDHFPKESETPVWIDSDRGRYETSVKELASGDAVPFHLLEEYEVHDRTFPGYFFKGSKVIEIPWNQYHPDYVEDHPEEFGFDQEQLWMMRDGEEFPLDIAVMQNGWATVRKWRENGVWKAVLPNALNRTLDSLARFTDKYLMKDKNAPMLILVAGRRGFFNTEPLTVEKVAAGYLETMRESVEPLDEAMADRFYAMWNTIAPPESLPEYEEQFRNTVRWATKTLKREDRVVWFLRYAQAHFWLVMLDEVRDPQYRRRFEQWFDRMTEENSFPDRHDHRGSQMVSYLKQHLDDLQQVFVHFLGMNIPEIEDHRFTPDDGLDLFHHFKEVSENHVEASDPTISDEEERKLHPVEDFITFPDGWKWVLKHVEACSIEGMLLNHCGNNSKFQRPGDEVLSLREPVGGGEWMPHLTFILNHGEVSRGVGRNNAKPSAKFNPYIVGLLSDPRVKEVSQHTNLTDEDWTTIVSRNPELIINEPDYLTADMAHG